MTWPESVYAAIVIAGILSALIGADSDDAKHALYAVIAFAVLVAVIATALHWFW